MAKQHDTLKNAIERVLEVDADSLISRDSWGTITFEAAEEAIRSIYQVVGLLSELPIERIPATAAQEITEPLGQIIEEIGKINSFSIETDNQSPTAVRNDIVNRLKDREQALYERGGRWIPFLAYLKGDIPNQLNEISNAVARAKKEDGDFSGWLGGRRTEFDGIIEATRQASASAGVGVFNSDFENDGTNRDDDAKTWLIAAIVSAAATLIAAVIFFWIKADPATGHFGLIQFTTSKLVILAMLIAATAWCASNYRANKHQAAISRHKAHALKTFQAFVQASDNPQVRDAVLLETTRSIFTHPTTGYIRGDSGGSEPASKIIEIVKDGVERQGG